MLLMYLNNLSALPSLAVLANFDGFLTVSVDMKCSHSCV